MDVLKEILIWSESRPNWQRDALRRIIAKGDLDQSDIEELLIQCKATHGFEKQVESIPLDEAHIPKQDKSVQRVILGALTHEKGVNALAENQNDKVWRMPYGGLWSECSW